MSGPAPSRGTAVPDTFEDFVAWRDERCGEKLTVGDAMRHFTGTPLDTILAWWSRDMTEQAAYRHAMRQEADDA